MSALGRTAAEWESSRNTGAAVCAVFTAATGVLEVAGGPTWLKITFAGLAVIGAIAVVVSIC